MIINLNPDLKIWNNITVYFTERERWRLGYEVWVLADYSHQLEGYCLALHLLRTSSLVRG